MKKATKENESVSHEKFTQLPLPFIFHGKARNKQYSNTIELYDAIPKYYWGNRLNRIEGQFLEPIEREFQHRDILYRVIIKPAKIKEKNGKYKEYFPRKREELIEDALRKLASDGKGVFMNNHAGVLFSLYEIQQELKRIGHTFNLPEIKEALLICNQTHIQLETLDGKSIISSSLFETLGLQTREDWKGKGKKTKCFVKFNILVDKSIKERSFRQINYDICMSYKYSLARWLHKRMAHIYLQASWKHPYHIMCSTILRDSGITSCKRLRDNLRGIRQALEEMKGKGIIAEYEEVATMDGRKIVDVKFIIKPGYIFINDMKNGHIIKKKFLDKNM